MNFSCCLSKVLKKCQCSLTLVTFRPRHWRTFRGDLLWTGVQPGRALGAAAAHHSFGDSAQRTWVSFERCRRTHQWRLCSNKSCVPFKVRVNLVQLCSRNKSIIFHSSLTFCFVGAFEKSYFSNVLTWRAWVNNQSLLSVVIYCKLLLVSPIFSQRAFSPTFLIYLLVCFFSPLCYTLFYSGTEKKKEKPPGQKEKKEESQSNDQSPQTQASPSPQPSSQTLQTHRQTQESKSSAPAKRFSLYTSTELENPCNDTELISDNKSCEIVPVSWSS